MGQCFLPCQFSSVTQTGTVVKLPHPRKATFTWHICVTGSCRVLERIINYQRPPKGHSWGLPPENSVWSTDVATDPVLQKSGQTLPGPCRGGAWVYPHIPEHILTHWTLFVTKKTRRGPVGATRDGDYPSILICHSLSLPSLFPVFLLLYFTFTVK